MWVSGQESCRQRARGWGVLGVVGERQGDGWTEGREGKAVGGGGDGGPCRLVTLSLSEVAALRGL